MGSKTNWAILNGFGISLGDSLIGLQALSAAQQLGVIDHVPVLYRKPGLRRMVDKLYPVAEFARVVPLPETLDAADLLGDFARVIDMRDFAFDADFRGVAMIDFFFARLGIDPTTVPGALKRNAWLAPRVRPVMPDFGSGYALVCPVSSMSMRDMPPAAHARVLRVLLDAGWKVATQGRVPEELEGRVVRVPALETVDQLAGLVAHAACMISTDTAMVHLADAFDVPCLAFFTTHRPAWRVRDYPHCTAVHLPAKGLPEALEFLRSPTDLQATMDAWTLRGADFAWLEADLLGFLREV